MSDPTEPIRREMVAQLNAVEGSREYLEAKHGEVWDTTELQEQFEVTRVTLLEIRSAVELCSGITRYSSFVRRTR